MAGLVALLLGRTLTWVALLRGEERLLVRRLTSVLPCCFQQGGESDGCYHPEGQPQRLPPSPEVRPQPARKVTLTKGALPQPQHPPVAAHVHSAGPPAIKSIQGIHPPKKVPPVPWAPGNVEPAGRQPSAGRTVQGLPS